MDFAGYAQAAAAYAQFIEMAQAMGSIPGMMEAFAAASAGAAPAAAAPVFSGKGKGKGIEGRPGDWNCPGCNDLQFGRNSSCRRCGTARPAPGSLPAARPAAAAFAAESGKGMRPGDWNCPRCGDHVFAKNDSCRRCGSGKPDDDSAMAAMIAAMFGQAAAAAPAAGGKPGDWNCPACGDLQFARNTACRRCGAANPLGDLMAAASSARAPAPNAELRPGDWICPRCNDHVFARNEACRRCSTPRPSSAEMAAQAGSSSRGGGGKGDSNMKPGDWRCPSCKDMQFARNSVCRMCNTPKPDEGSRERSRSR